MNVITAADSAGVAEAGRDLVNDFQENSLRAALPGEKFHRVNGAGPGPEILGGEILAGDLLEVIVDIAGRHRLDFLLIVYIFKKLMAGEFLAIPDNFRETLVGKLDPVLLPALAPKLETQTGASHLDMPVAQGAQAVRLIVARVFQIADTHVSRLQKAHDSGEDFFARQSGQAQVLPDTAPDRGKNFCEIEQPVKLGRIANGAPFRMIPILPAAAIIETGCLQMPVGISANPDILPGGWDGEFANSIEIVRAHGTAIRMTVMEPFSMANPPDSGHPVMDVMQMSLARRLENLRSGCGQIFSFFARDQPESFRT